MDIMFAPIVAISIIWSAIVEDPRKLKSVPGVTKISEEKTISLLEHIKVLEGYKNEICKLKSILFVKKNAILS